MPTDLQKDLLDIEDIARVLRRTPEAIHVARKRAPHTVPPRSFKIGRKLYWRRVTVEEWLAAEEKRQNSASRAQRTPAKKT